MKLVLLLVFISISANAKHYKCNKNLSCGCGYTNVEINARIINGEEAVPYSWSMIVSIRYDLFQDGNFLRHTCGGTILTDSYILTAASCFDYIVGDKKLAHVSIAAGIHRRSQPLQIIREVDEFIIHTNWTTVWNSDYDIALLHLSEPLDFQRNPLISRTCLSPQLDNSEELIQYPPIGTTLAVVGWGRTVAFKDDSDILRQIIVSSIDQNNTRCIETITDPKRQFCTGSNEISTGLCYGDFGGPIFQWIEDHWEQVGIASFTSDSCKQNSIIGYTRLAYYRDWIEENIKNNNETTEEIPVTITTPPIAITETPSHIYQCDKHAVSCGCGRRNVQLPSTSISIDNEAIPYSWSMIVSIRLNNMNKHLCSGSILSESYILTSASCLVNVSSFGITIVAGIHNHSGDNAIYRKVDQIYFHPDYMGSEDNNANDIAILHISQAFNFDNDFFISPICLPKKNEILPESTYYPAPGAPLIVIGWGSMNCQNHTDQQLLQQVQVYSVNDLEKNCYILNKHREIQFCAGLKEENIVPCVRDPGSPIFQWLKDRWQQVGIASYVIDCIQFRNLGIYTRIIEYNDWIQSIINTCSTTSPTPPPPLTTPDIRTTIRTANTTTTSVKRLELYQCNQTSTCGCGSVPVVLSPARIIGGEKAVEYSWPMMVSIRWRFDDNHVCGGSILSNSYILTAAHCLYGDVSNPPEQFSISVGMTNLSDPKQIRRIVDHIYIHPDYVGRDSDSRNDIALVHINQPLPIEHSLFLTKTCIHRVNLPILNDQYIKNGTRLTVIGWGTTKNTEFNKPIVLQQVQVYAIDNEDPICKAAMTDSQTQFCAGLPEGGKDACQGDSGGPIFQWTGQYWEQLGIVSYGDGCAEANNPGVYTRLSYYYDWINNILKKDNEHLEPELSSDETSIKPDITTTSTLASNTTTRSTLDSNTTTAAELNSNTTTTSTLNSNITTTVKPNSNATTTSTLDSNTTTTYTLNSNATTTAKLDSNTTITSTLNSNVTTTYKPASNTTTTAEPNPNTTTTSTLNSNDTTTAKLDSNTTITSTLNSNVTTTYKPASNTTTTAEPNPNTTTTSTLNSNDTTTAKLDSNTTITSTLNSNVTTTYKPASNTTTTAEPNPNTTTTPTLNSNTTTTSTLDSNTTTTSKLDSNTTTTAEPNPNTTTAPTLNSNATTTAKLASNTTTTAEPNPKTTTRPTLNSNATTTAKLDSNTTTTSKPASNTTTTAKLDSNTTATSEMHFNISTTTDEATSTRKSDAYSHQENTLTFAILILLFSMFV